MRARASRRRWRPCAGVAVALALAVPGAAFAAAPAADAPARPPVVQVRDDLGRTVSLPAPARRIVALAPHATELLFALGAGPRLVAVERSSDYPSQALALPRVGAHPRPDPERIAALAPDLVVLWGAGTARQTARRLAALGMTTFVSEPRTIEDIASSLERLGALAGARDEGIAQARRLRERAAALRARYASRVAVPVFVQAWPRPLMTLTDRDTLGAALRVCGARNVFGDLATAAAQVDREAVLRRAPRLIIAFEGEADRGAWQRLGVLAPQGGIDYLEVDRAMQRPTPRLVDALERTCARIDRLRDGP